MTRFYAA